MTKTLKMTLAIGASKSVTFSLLDPREDLTKEAVTAVLEELIAKKAIVVGGSYPTAVKEVYVRSVEEKKIA